MRDRMNGVLFGVGAAAAPSGLGKTRCECRCTDAIGAARRRGTCSTVLTAIVTLATARSAVLPIVHRVTARGTAGPSVSTRVAAAAGMIAAAGAARGRTRRAAAAQRRAAPGTASRSGAPGTASGSGTARCLRASGPGGACLSGTFNTHAAPAFELAIATAASKRTAVGARRARVGVLARLRATQGNEQRDRKPNQTPTASQHVVLVRPRGPHARQPQARCGLGAPTKEARL